MTIPWAYLHPRFQGQEPPGFPGRFTPANYRPMSWTRFVVTSWPTWTSSYPIATSGLTPLSARCPD
ncbi:hypothetical protein C1S80_19865 [Mycolicibacterium aubagnense]|nr:hypothetical protein C1S80_19865 [Mycolicibacterium aubagnense]